MKRTTKKVSKGSMVLLKNGSEVLALSDTYKVEENSTSCIPGWGSVMGFDAVDDLNKKRFVQLSEVSVFSEY